MRSLKLAARAVLALGSTGVRRAAGPWRRIPDVALIVRYDLGTKKLQYIGLSGTTVSASKRPPLTNADDRSARETAPRAPYSTVPPRLSQCQGRPTSSGRQQGWYTTTTHVI
eukprot:4690676-Pleurochrysis_carterae.AAC.3